MSNKCRRCSTHISDERNYCTAHYLEAMADYERDLNSYYYSMEIWNSMSAEGKKLAHKIAEDKTLKNYSSTVGFILGAILWYNMYESYYIDALPGIAILVLFVFAFTNITAVRFLIGRLARLIVHGVIYFIGVWIVGAIISNWSPELKENEHFLTIALAILVTVITIVLEITGKHHASGEPKMPSKPSP